MKREKSSTIFMERARKTNALFNYASFLLSPEALPSTSSSCLVSSLLLCSLLFSKSPSQGQADSLSSGPTRTKDCRDRVHISGSRERALALSKRESKTHLRMVRIAFAFCPLDINILVYIGSDWKDYMFKVCYIICKGDTFFNGPARFNNRRLLSLKQ